MSFSSTLRPRHVVTVMNQSFRANLPGPLRAVCAIVGLLAGIAQGGPLHERVASFDRPATTPFFGALVAGPDGDLWGTTYSGGVNSFGTLYKVKADASAWQTVLAFTSNGASNKGASPNAGLLLDAGGVFWGTTNRGGALNFGTVFKVNAATGVLTTVLEFSGNGSTNKGSAPRAGLVRGDDGNYWGTTGEGGASGNGTIFRIHPVTGALTTVVQFTDNGASNKGKGPHGALVRGAGGMLWGTTTTGGASGLGTVFRLNTSTGVLTTVVQFTGTSGAAVGSYAAGALVADGAGSFWGTTYWGGTRSLGTVFKVRESSGAFTSVISFMGNPASTNRGALPRSALAPDGEGYLWGTTTETGGSGSTTTDNGTVFKIQLSTGVLTTIAVFNRSAGPPLGRFPQGDLYHHSSGYVWGTTGSGGLSGNGTVYRVHRATGALQTVIDFTTGNISPRAGLVSDAGGFLWGISRTGGALGFGSVFKIDPATNTTVTVLEFTGNGAINKGRSPLGGLTVAEDGWLWGCTYEGGAAGYGTIFKIHPATGDLVTVKNISSSESGFKNPNAPLVADGSGYFWGTCNPGDNGSIFKIHATTGVMTTVIRFTRETGAYKGAFPHGGLMADGAGWLWGTTNRGGTGDNGTVFKFEPDTGTFITLAEFTFTSGAQPGFEPSGRLVRDGSGFVWGTARGGGSQNFGTLFKIHMGTGVFTSVLQFSGNGASNKGSRPQGGMVFDGTSLWGATLEGGTIGHGTVFKVNPATGLLTTVVNFAGVGSMANAGRLPSDGALYRHPDGHIYGATAEGGPGGLGTVYRLRFGPLPVTQAATGVTAVGATLRGTVNANGASSPVSFEYGTTPTLDDAKTVGGGTANGTSAQSFSGSVSGLAPGTQHYFRIVSSNPENANPQRGAIFTFTTEANLPPVFPGFTVATPHQTAVSIALRKLLAGVSDPDGDTFIVAGAGPVSANDGVVVLQPTAILYTPPVGFTGADNFPVTILDARGVSVTGTVVVNVGAGPTVGAVGTNPPLLSALPDGRIGLAFRGIPGRSYAVQRSASGLNHWVTLATVIADTNGRVVYTDESPPPGSAFYRLALP